MTLFVAALFVALTPGVLVTLPSKGSKLTSAVVHGLIFAVVYHLTRKAVSHFLRSNGLGSTAEAFQTEAFEICDAAKASVKLFEDATNAAIEADRVNAPNKGELLAAAQQAQAVADEAKNACTAVAQPSSM